MDQTWSLAASSIKKKMVTKSKCASVAGNFDGHVDALKQCTSLEATSHWTLSSGDFSLRIAPAAARATINKMTMKNKPTLLAILMAVVMHWYGTVQITQWRRFIAFMEATKHCHRASTRSDNIKVSSYRDDPAQRDVNEVLRMGGHDPHLFTAWVKAQRSQCSVGTLRISWCDQLDGCHFPLPSVSYWCHRFCADGWVVELIDSFCITNHKNQHTPT